VNAVRAASEEYLLIAAIIDQMAITIKAVCQERANKIPIAVATPFPPLNFIQIGNI
jgi:hypothetical protein